MGDRLGISQTAVYAIFAALADYYLYTSTALADYHLYTSTVIQCHQTQLYKTQLGGRVVRALDFLPRSLGFESTQERYWLARFLVLAAQWLVYWLVPEFQVRFLGKFF